MLGAMVQKLGSSEGHPQPPLATGLPGVHLDIHLRSTYKKFPAVSSSDAMEPNLESVTRRHGCDRVSSDKAGLAEARTGIGGPGNEGMQSDSLHAKTKPEPHESGRP